ncbi:MAG TPA: DNA-3-methyladenine glycosylase 2 family protein [Thermoanaerobaculia bacterium]|nr:DNA-3-methyladenine glycosylase 2 family protein [Thermoanaerobaculia bacterium]
MVESADVVRCTLPVDGPYDLGGTMGQLRVLAHPGLWIGAGEAWHATRNADGVATLRLRHAGARVEVEAWGPGATRALDGAAALAGLEDDGAAAFEPLAEPLRTLRRRRPGLRLPRTGAVLETLLPTVLAQKVSGKEAGQSWLALVRRHGERAPGPAGAPELWLSPTVETLRSLAYEDFHPFGIERRRAETLRRVAARAGRLQEALAMPLPAAYARLQALEGIGPWSAAKVLLVAAGDPDAVPVGDYNLPALVAWNLAHEPRADDARMLELLEPYLGRRARVLQLLHVAGENPPRFGPRQELRRIERW